MTIALIGFRSSLSKSAERHLSDVHSVGEAHQLLNATLLYSNCKHMRTVSMKDPLADERATTFLSETVGN